MTLYTNQIYPFLKQDTCKFVRSVQSTLYSLFIDTTYITGEATATEINLPVGDPENNYTIYLRVFISDVYGDYNVSDLTVIVSNLFNSARYQNNMLP